MEFNKNVENVSFSVDVIWHSYRKKNECCCTSSPVDAWKEGVQQYYEGTSKVAKKLSVRTYDEAETIMNAFQMYLTKLIYFTNSNSTVLSTKSAAILEALSKLNKLHQSPTTILKETERALPKLIEDYTKIVASLSEVIGQLTIPVNDSLNDLEGSIIHFIKEFFNSSALGFRKKVDFKPVIKHAQVLINTIALIAETVLDECNLATPNVYESLTVLSLILIHLLISVQGVNICTQEVLYSRSLDIPVVLNVCLLPMISFAKEITDSVVSIKLPLTESIADLLTKLVELTIFLNSILDELFGVFEGVTLTVGQITQSLSKSLFRIENALN